MAKGLLMASTVSTGQEAAKLSSTAVWRGPTNVLGAMPSWKEIEYSEDVPKRYKVSREGGLDGVEDGNGVDFFDIDVGDEPQTAAFRARPVLCSKIFLITYRRLWSEERVTCFLSASN